MAGFDPDKFLGGFNPDSFTEEKTEEGYPYLQKTDVAKTAEDVGRSAGSGLVNAVTGMAGMNPATFGRFIPQAAHLGAQQANPEIPDKEFQSQSEWANKEFGGEYKPQTEVGKYTKSIAEMVPASIAGPGNAIRKGAEAIGGGMGAQALGDLAEGTMLEAPARMAGSVLGMQPVARGYTAVNNARRINRTPTTNELFRVSNHQFDSARATGAVYDPFRTQQLQGNIERALDDAGHSTQEISNVLDSVNRLTSFQLPSFGNLLGVRSRLNRIAQKRDPGTGRATEPAQAARTAIDHIDDFLGDAQNAWMHGPNPQQNMRAMQTAVEHVADARGNWNAALRDSELALAMRKGLNNAAGEGSGTNIDNRLRQQMRNIANNPSKIGKFDAETQAAIQDVIRGDAPRNTARLIGKLAITGTVPALTLSALAHAFGLGLPATIAAGAAGYSTKFAADRATRNHILRVRESLRGNSPLGETRNIPDRLTPWREGQRSPIVPGRGIPSHAPKPPLASRPLVFPLIEGMHGLRGGEE